MSVSSNGVQGNADSANPSISADGRYVVFVSDASNLVVGDTNTTTDVFVHDRATGQTQRVNVTSSGDQSSDLSYLSPGLENNDMVSISADGRYVAFVSDAANLGADTRVGGQIFVHDRITGMTEGASVNSSGDQANSTARAPRISADGRHVAFQSIATNLVAAAGVGLGRGQVYVHERASVEPPSPGPEDPQPRPDPPVVQPLPPTEPLPDRTSTNNLVLIVHGWNSSSDDWPTTLGYTIQDKIAQRQQQGLMDTKDVWTVATVDWRDAAGYGCLLLPCFVQWNAYANATSQGEAIGRQLSTTHYDQIHFIAHSAGSQLVDSAAGWLRSHAASGRQPFIHTTFLDAYHPFPDLAVYGGLANWAEQYVDTRDSLVSVAGWGVIENTNLTLPNAFNFDVTSLDDRNFVTIVQAHAWPYLWYQETAEFPASWNYGWRASKERDPDRLPSHEDLARGGRCVIFSESTVCSTPSSVTRTLEFSPVQNAFDVWLNPSTVSIATSSTGTVSISTPQQISLTVGSPVWVTLRADVVEPLNSMQLAYQFSDGSDGLLSVFLDDQLVYRSDQRFTDEGLSRSGIVPLGNIVPGRHSLSFRLDHFSNSNPTVTISEITFGIAQLVERVNAAPVADAGDDQTARVGDTVRLSGD